MLESDFICRGSSPATTATTAEAALKLRAISPAVSTELAMRNLMSSYHQPGIATPSPVLSPTTSTSTLSALQLPSAPMLGFSSVGAGSSAALLDHYSRVMRSRALARSLYELERKVGISGYSNAHARTLPIKKAARTKFVCGRAGAPRGLKQKLASSGLKPLGPPPALPKANPGQKIASAPAGGIQFRKY